MQHRSPPLVFVRVVATWIALAAASVAQSTSVPFLDRTFQIYPIGDLHYATKWNPSAGRFDRLAMDLYLPLDNASTTRPCFVYLHGGSFRRGTRRDPYVFRMCAEMAQRGYVAAAVSYRLRVGSGSGIGSRSCGEDCQDAIGWLTSNASTLRLDSNRVVVTGDSAGAAGAVYAAFGQGSGRPTAHPVRAIGALWGWESTPVRANGTAVYVAHGENDQVVPWSLGKQLHLSALNAGLESHFLSMLGGHAPWGQFDEFFNPMVEFFYRALKLSQVAGLQVSGTGVSAIQSAVVVGPADRTCVLRWSPKRSPLDLGSAGILDLDLSVSRLVDIPRPPVPGLIAQRAFRAVVPAGLPNVYWQALFFGTGPGIELVSNSLTTHH